MVIADLRKELEDARRQLEEGHTDKAKAQLDHALHELDDNHLLTTSKAADALELGSVNTLKLLVRKTGVRTVMHGNRMMIPVSSLVQLQDSTTLRGLQASDRQHDALSALGSDDGMSQEEMSDLQDSRPGVLPWSKKKSPTGV